MKALYVQGEIIAERYQIVTFLGQGGMGSTYAAVDLRTHQRVAIKVVSLQEVRGWKTIELFEREAQVLATLNHPSIPKYLDYFKLDVEQDTDHSDYRFYLVQELVEGESLAALVKQGWHTTEAEVKNIAIQVLEILTYIHQLNPPIIHRDIKPQNIIRSSNGKIYLVDFGAVKSIYIQTMSGTKTLVGTFGYMPIEQFHGQIDCASDLYSLGCTLIFLLTHRFPADLPHKRMKIDFHQGLKISDDFANWLDQMIEPFIEKRLQSAIEALEKLEQGHLVPTIPKPKLTYIKLNKTAEKLIIKIPHYNGKKGSKLFTNICRVCLVFIIFMLSLFNFITFPINLLFVSLSLLVLYNIFKYFTKFLTQSCELEIKPHIFKIYINGYGFFNEKICIQGDTEDLQIMKNSDRFCSLQYKGRQLPLDPTGEELTDIEKRWLYQEITNFIKQLH